MAIDLFNGFSTVVEGRLRLVTENCPEIVDLAVGAVESSCNTVWVVCIVLLVNFRVGAFGVLRCKDTQSRREEEVVIILSQAKTILGANPHADDSDG